MTTAGSSTNASLGGVSGVVVDVTHNGAPPVALLATQPEGKAGAVTPSKFSLKEPHGVGVTVPPGVKVAVGVAVAVGVGDGEADGNGLGEAPPGCATKAPMRNRHAAPLVVGKYWFTYQKVVSSVGSTDNAV